MRSERKGPVDGNFGREVVLREVPSSCTNGCQRASFELLMKKATSHLLALRVSLRHLHVFGYDPPKVVDVQQKEERRQGEPLREPLA